MNQLLWTLITLLIMAAVLWYVWRRVKPTIGVTEPTLERIALDKQTITLMAPVKVNNVEPVRIGKAVL